MHGLIKNKSFFNKSIWFIDGTQTGTLGQNEPGSTPHSSDLQKWSLTIRCSRQPLFRVFLPLWHYVGGPPSRQSLCLFWRETRQKVWTRDLNATGSRKRTPVGELEEGTQRKQLVMGDAGWQLGSRHRTAEVTSRHEIESSISEGRPVKISQHSS